MIDIKDLHPWYIKLGMGTISIVDKELGIIALLPDKGEKALDQATLLAAAPDLYVVLLRVRKWLLDMGVQDDIVTAVKSALNLLERGDSMRALKLHDDAVWGSVKQTLDDLPK